MWTDPPPRIDAVTYSILEGESMKKRILWMLPVAAAAATAVAVAEPPGGPSPTGVPTANTKSPGYAPASRLSPELAQIAVAQGSPPVENPDAQIAHYGYDSDRVDTGNGLPLMVPLTGAPTVEAHKTEPDKNTYLMFKDGLHGADAN
jgi:hypothetical protein